MRRLMEDWFPAAQCDVKNKADNETNEDGNNAHRRKHAFAIFRIQWIGANQRFVDGCKN